MALAPGMTLDGMALYMGNPVLHALGLESGLGPLRGRPARVRGGPPVALGQALVPNRAFPGTSRIFTVIVLCV